MPKTKQKTIIEPEKVFHRVVEHADGSRHRADLGLIRGGNTEPLTQDALSRILKMRALKSLKLLKALVCILIVITTIKVHADGDTSAMVDALNAADLNYQQDHDQKIIDQKDDQIRALQDQIQSQDD